ncbi:MAG: hypothetical protein ACK5PR_02645 [bacterium]|jgi:hypothetical protein
MTDLLARIERGEPVEAQEVFDFAVSKVIEQEAPSVDGDGCMYRNHLGQKCAFGHLIPDSLYKHSFENVTSDGIINSEAKNLQYSPALAASLECHASLIYDLQRVHDAYTNCDNSFFVTNFRQRAEAVAKDHGLTFKF